MTDENDRPLRVVLLGKERYRGRPTIGRFLTGAKTRGHTAELVDRDAFLSPHRGPIDLVLAKSHYKNSDVRRRLASLGTPVINSLDSTAICDSRTRLAQRLLDHGVPTPPFARDGTDDVSMRLPWIAKPDTGRNHRHTIMYRRQTSLDRRAFFYQRFLPSHTIFKVYSIGDRHDLVELTYRSTTDLDHATRAYRGRANASLAEAANRVAAATGLEIFNTDFIRHGPDFLAIDVNPFPSFDSVPDADRHLWRLVEASLTGDVRHRSDRCS